MSSHARPSGLLGQHAALPAALRVPSAPGARAVARWVVIAFVVFAVAVALSPWQQSVRGRGEVVAFAPQQRQQRIDATLTGRVEKWLVQEGDAVRKGQPLVELVDNDPLRMSRLETQRVAVESRVSNHELRVSNMRERLAALRRSMRAQIASAEAEVSIARESQITKRRALEAAEAELETAELQLARQRQLVEPGLISQRELELAQLAARQAHAKLASAKAALRAADRTLEAKQAALDRARATAEADLENAQASLREAENALAGEQAKMAQIGSDVARQQAGLVKAPRDGVIMRIVAREGGEQVSQGKPLAWLVPDTADRAVALRVDGNDAALIQPGSQVRLQFEGWPAVQFVGWPSVAVGTFGGRVQFVDASDDGEGNFRVIVMPDPEDDPWPEPRYLRQGVRAKGWFLLRQVSLGYELWRQLNGFPPALDEPAKLQERPAVPSIKQTP